MNARIVIIEQTDSPRTTEALESLVSKRAIKGYWTLVDADCRSDDETDRRYTRERLNVPAPSATVSEYRNWRSSDERAVIVDLLSNLCHLIGREAFDEAVDMARFNHSAETMTYD
jgi:hypothetical protein